MKKQKVFKIISLLLIVVGLLTPIFNFSKNKIDKHIEEKVLAQKIDNKEDYFAIIEVPKINLKKELYDINDKRNNVDKNILVHKTSKFPQNIILASHSGNSKKAFFKNLYKLQIKDSINIFYQNKIYEYIVEDIEEQNKDGELYIKDELYERLILITCSKNNNKTQVIYYSKLRSIKDI